MGCVHSLTINANILLMENFIAFCFANACYVMRQYMSSSEVFVKPKSLKSIYKLINQLHTVIDMRKCMKIGSKYIKKCIQRKNWKNFSTM